MMNNIVRLERSNRSTKATTCENPSGAGAEIILFPGVRYERWGAVSAGVVTRAGADGVRRDVIDL
jgi:hypothetical protein